MRGIRWHLSVTWRLYRMGQFVNPLHLVQSIYWAYRWRYWPPKPLGHGGE